MQMVRQKHPRASIVVAGDFNRKRSAMSNVTRSLDLSLMQDDQQELVTHVEVRNPLNRKQLDYVLSNQVAIDARTNHSLWELSDHRLLVARI